MNWRLLHLSVGTLGLLLFVLQGQYMDRVLLVGDLPDLPRMHYRSAHIYLMLASALNICAACIVPRHGGTPLLLRLASPLFLLAPALLLLSFFTESGSASIDRPLATLALYAAFGGAVLMAIHTINATFRPASPPQ